MGGLGALFTADPDRYPQTGTCRIVALENGMPVLKFSSDIELPVVHWCTGAPAQMHMCGVAVHSTCGTRRRITYVGRCSDVSWLSQAFTSPMTTITMTILTKTFVDDMQNAKCMFGIVGFTFYIAWHALLPFGDIRISIY